MSKNKPECSAASDCSGASIDELRSIAWLANQIVGGGCCQGHLDQHWRNLQQKLRLFVDDLYTQLKSEFALAGDSDNEWKSPHRIGVVSSQITTAVTRLPQERIDDGND